MISRKTRRGIIALVVLTGVSFWAAREQRDDTSEPVTGLDPRLNYVLHDFNLQVFDVNGKATLNIKAPVLSNDPVLGIGTIENPLLILHQQGVTWKLVADWATITSDKERVKLSGSVYVQRLELLTGNRVEFKTSEIEVEVTPQIASTAEPVSLFDGHNHMDAVGMQLDMMNDTFHLNQEVRAIYAVN